jgi:cardiolipin synthase A/B
MQAPGGALEMIYWMTGIALVWGAGLVTAYGVLHERRSPEGTLAWVLALLGIPFLAVPIYWLLGSHRDLDYRAALREAMRRARGRDPRTTLAESFGARAGADFPVLTRLSPFAFVGGNRVELLIDGEATFAALERALEEARDYLLVEFYTIALDATGRRFLEGLRAAATRGVRVYLLYDAWGSYGLDRRRAALLSTPGLEALAFRIGRHGIARPKLNFRNHRKIVVVDGRVAFFGGCNVADAYRGRHPRMSPWRDTQVRLEGPAVRQFQSIIAADWHCTSGGYLEDLHWDSPAIAGGAEAIVIPTGPVERGDDDATMLLHALAREARYRLWISSPYVITSDGILELLRGAVLRGVEVCVLMTGMRDHHTTFRAGFFFARELRAAGVRVLRYREGFLHQKAILVDDRLAALGSLNLDNRSLSLNFEVTAVFADAPTVAAVTAMMEKDLARGLDTTGEWEVLSSRARLLAATARLFAPLL